MNAKTGAGTGANRGRLVFCPHTGPSGASGGDRTGRVGGVARRYYEPRHTPGVGWLAVVGCALGDHYLAPDPRDGARVVERTVGMGGPPHAWGSAYAALAAIDQLGRQQAEPQAEQAETVTETEDAR